MVKTVVALMVITIGIILLNNSSIEFVVLPWLLLLAGATLLIYTAWKMGYQSGKIRAQRDNRADTKGAEQ